MSGAARELLRLIHLLTIRHLKTVASALYIVVCFSGTRIGEHGNLQGEYWNPGSQPFPALPGVAMPAPRVHATHVPCVAVGTSGYLQSLTAGALNSQGRASWPGAGGLELQASGTTGAPCGATRGERSRRPSAGVSPAPGRAVTLPLLRAGQALCRYRDSRAVETGKTGLGRGFTAAPTDGLRQRKGRSGGGGATSEQPMVGRRGAVTSPRPAETHLLHKGAGRPPPALTLPAPASAPALPLWPGRVPLGRG